MSYLPLLRKEWVIFAWCWPKCKNAILNSRPPTERWIRKWTVENLKWKVGRRGRPVCWITLLMCALIEARSCERFKRLSEGLEDAYLRKILSTLYGKWGRALHFIVINPRRTTYIAKEKVRRRWKDMAEPRKDNIISNMDMLRRSYPLIVLIKKNTQTIVVVLLKRFQYTFFAIRENS